MNNIRYFAMATLSGMALTFGLAGCTHDRPEDLSGNAVQVVQGNKSLEYRATAEGTVTVYDNSTAQVIYKGQIMKGQTLTVDTTNNHINIDGQVVSQQSLHGGDQNTIFFAPTN